MQLRFVEKRVQYRHWNERMDDYVTDTTSTKMVLQMRKGDAFPWEDVPLAAKVLVDVEGNIKETKLG